MIAKIALNPTLPRANDCKISQKREPNLTRTDEVRVRINSSRRGLDSMSPHTCCLQLLGLGWKIFIWRTKSSHVPPDTDAGMSQELIVPCLLDVRNRLKASKWGRRARTFAVRKKRKTRQAVPEPRRNLRKNSG